MPELRNRRVPADPEWPVPLVRPGSYCAGNPFGHVTVAGDHGRPTCQSCRLPLTLERRAAR